MRDAGEQGVQADGSTDLGRLVHLGLWSTVLVPAYTNSQFTKSILAFTRTLLAEARLDDLL